MEDKFTKKLEDVKLFYRNEVDDLKLEIQTLRDEISILKAPKETTKVSIPVELSVIFFISCYTFMRNKI